ncbi:glycosyltransferase [Helicobacter sp. MIT 14-3879]|uniref:glycosyltransferase n=1 Tax=Helicobacter sp. MIT 14-3879 TaxID=2040649 RepID=UPI000E1EA718|nr:glycosyltransferase [Helicobacter sp. MIT 14-3879]RDU65128.1 glycosyl transferase [Helicobacter sp. MIT 14-3879]
MIIVIVVDCFKNKSNGTAVSANNLSITLKNKGHIVRVVAPYISGDNMYCVKERYIPFVTKIAHSQNMHFGDADSKILRKAFKDADIIHFFLPFKLEIVGVKIAREMGIPYIGAFHLQPEHITYNANLRWIPFAHKFIFWLFKHRMYYKIKHIHCPSKMIADELRKNNFNSKLFVISNGFNASFMPLPKQRDNNFFHIIMTGRYSTEKRQDILINAVKLSKYEKQIKLHLKGSGPRENYYKKISHSLSNKVDFGFVSKDELINLYSKMDIYVHTADIDGEAISALEAIACGVVPIISDSKLSATKQFTLDERSLFKRGNAKDLAQKIDYFIENKHILHKLGKEYSKSAKDYDLNICVDKMLDLYNEAIRDFKDSAK